ncbi:RCC1 domain-containing protein [Niabella drilacis]|uniref:Regulator of chromosome condensation (RCC1) repeat-containing protein n=1 Tax=Niabella drilacis (strain DSM 25811 / CCM 8410 / CCUG 62505 / LMG 26954 / E90) TaxID=1285928 RepID=A0A1G6ZXQ2_NIADE|nr:hypothetical protein [Niabella drilacis]SDE07454.1 hypothetical protein SAMN04487894_1208 [Niabella drilacis]
MTQRKMTTAALSVLFCMMLLGFSRSAVQAQCTDCGNSYLNVDPSNLDRMEYDNIVSTFHSTMARQADGRVLVWGEDTRSDGVSSNLTPAELNSSNYPGLQGTVLKFTGGSNAGSTNGHQAQFAVLTTQGLYVWGAPDKLITSSLKNNTTFGRVFTAAQLPVAPDQVRMLFGTYQTLALVTCSDDVWVLSINGNMRGNGNNGNASTWARVTENGSGNPVLGNVMAVRGAPGGLMALKKDGTVWTWGDKVYLADGTSVNDRSRARQMTLTKPQGGGNIVPKMIGMTGTRSRSSHYILGTDNVVYSLGNNERRQLGDRTTDEQENWVRVKSGSNTYLDNVAWISPNEHDNYGNSSVNALTTATSANVWAWGNNERNMLGVSSGSNINPTNNISGLGSSKIMAVETGGHTSMVVKQCSGLFGYVGHRIYGSMANGSNADDDVSSYSFSTSAMDICGASTGATTLFPPQGTVHIGDVIQLVFTPANVQAANGVFTVEGDATITQGGVLTITGKSTGIKVTYTANGNCGRTSAEIVIDPKDIFLPATFDKVSAAIRGGQLYVDFTTLTEQNNSHFEIEASNDGKNFVKIGEVKSNAADGYSNTPLSYTFSIGQGAATGLLGLSVAVLGFAALLVKRRNKWMLMLAIVLGAGIFGVSSCTKQEATSIDTNSKLFIRIKQVDKDGGHSESKVVLAVQE